MQSSTLSAVVRCARYVMDHGSTGPLSTGESLAGALGANRADLLKPLGYTISEALDRIGPAWVEALASAEFREQLEASS